MRFSDCLEGFLLDAKARRLSDATLLDYFNTFRKFSDFIGSDTDIETIGTNEIKQFLSLYPQLKAKTLLNYHTGLSSLWQFLVRENILKENVVRQVERPVPDKVIVQPFSESELQLLFSSLEQSVVYRRSHNRNEMTHSLPNARRNRLMMLVMLDTGVRSSELVGLQVADIDLSGGKLFVRQGKGRKDRVIPFSPHVGKAMWQHLLELGKKKAEKLPLPTKRKGKIKNESPLDPKDYIFVNELGYPLARGSLLKLMYSIGERAGVPDTHPHRFRHTFAIMYLRNGGDVHTLQDLLGHTDSDMTKRYLAIATSDLERAHRRASPVANLGFRP